MVEHTRRKLMKSASGGITFSIFTGLASAEEPNNSDLKKGEDWDWKKYREILTEKYNREEAVVATNLTRKQLRKVNQGKSKAKANEDLKERLKSHPVTETIASDIHSVEKANTDHEYSIVEEDEND